MYRKLDPGKIIETVAQLRNRIHERLPGTGLSRVADELLSVSHEAAARAEWIARPHLLLRVLIGLCVLELVVIVVEASITLRVSPDLGNISEFIQAFEAGINAMVLIGAAMFFLFTLESRIKRKRALGLLHELRSLAHIVDMHQLTKDPHRICESGPDTDSSPKRTMTRFELSRYLDYCSEMLSLIGKLAALHVQRFDDPVVLNAVDEVEDICNGFSRKIWQKITLLQKPDTQ